MSSISLQNPLDQPKGKKRLLESLKKGLESEDYDSFRMIVAFAKSGPFRRLDKEINAWRAQGKSIETVIGIDEYGTSVEALDFALDKLDKVYVIHGKSSFRSTFHPKIFIFQGKKIAKVFIGSNNLTVGGTETNAESYISIDLQLPEDNNLLKQLNTIWKSSKENAKPLDKTFLKKLHNVGLVLEEKTMRTIRAKTEIAASESEKDYDTKLGFKKIPTVSASSIASNTKKTKFDGDWETYAARLDESGVSNLYWSVAKKNNHLDQQLWALDFVLKNDSRFQSSKERDETINKESKKHFPDTMEGVRALRLGRLIGLLKGTTPFEVSDAYQALEYPEENSDDKKNNELIITQQLEKFYFWNDIFSRTNRHLGPGGKTKTPELFHLYPVFFVYELILLLNQLDYSENSLTKFEINTFVILAQQHDDLEKIAERIMQFREHENPDELEEYLKNKSAKIDSRFYTILQYSRYFTFSSERISLKTEFVEEVRQRVDIFNELRKANKLIKFDTSNSGRYRDLLFSSKDTISYHRGL